MEILTLKGAGLFAWSNSKKNNCLFATANVYDSFNQSLSSDEEGVLQIYTFDVMNKMSSQQRMGITKVEGMNFTSLDWEAFGEAENYPYGIIASGFSDGSVALWDANSIISSRGADSGPQAYNKGLLCIQQVHSAPVATIAFNPFKQHLIASGGSEVVIHNIEANIADPDIFSPGDNLHQNSTITAVSWNRKVPHILASASQNGVSVVWDLKINKAIFNFSDHNKSSLKRNVSLSWNPEIPTQIGVVYDDERTPELQIWDLRNPQGPIFASNKGHSKGIHSLDWCLTDPSLITTLGRDNKLTFWNYKSEENDHIVSEKQLAEPALEVKMSPRLPAIYSVTNASGSSSVYTLNDENQIDNQLSNYAPRWLKPPIGARFSFDGRLAVFSEKSGVSIREYKVSLTDERVEPYIADFEKNFQTYKVDASQLSDNRVNSDYIDEVDREEWKFIKAIAQDDPEDIIAVLGLDKAKIIKKAEDYTGKVHSTGPSSTKKKTEMSEFVKMTYADAEEFFSSLATKDPKKRSAHAVDKEDKLDEKFLITETIQKNTNWDAGVEKIIKDNILVGNIEGAVDSALKNGRSAEALLLAYFKGPEFFRSTIKQYLTACTEPFVKGAIRNLVEGQMSELVKNYPLDQWKEIVAICLNYTSSNPKAFYAHMEELALRFINERNDHSTALLCYYLSRNFSRILENLAFRTESYVKGSLEYIVFLMRTIEKLTALRLITGNLESHPIVDRFVYEVSKTLHAYGRDAVTLNLITVNNSSGFECNVIRDRILHSNTDLVGQYPSRQFPYRVENVNPKFKKATKPEPTQKTVGGPMSMGGQMGGPMKVGIEKKPIFDPRGGQTEQVKPPMDMSKNTPFKQTNPISPPTDKTISNPMFTPKQDSTQSPFGSNPISNPQKTGFNPPHNPNLPKPVNTFNPNLAKEKQELPPPPIQKTTTPFTGFNEPEQKPPMGGSKINFPPPKLPTFTPSHTNKMSEPLSDGNKSPVNEMPPKTTTTFNKPGQDTPPNNPSFKTNPPPNKTMPGPSFKPNQPSFQNVSSSGSFQNTQLQQQQQQQGFQQQGFQQNTQQNVQQNNPPPFGGNRPPTNTVGGFKPPMNQPRAMPKPNTMSSNQSVSSSQTFSSSDIPSHCSHIYATVIRGMAILDQIDKNPRKKMEMEQKMNILFETLINGNMKETTFDNLSRLCEALDSENFEEAKALQERIAKEDWEANKEWLNSLRRIILRK